MFNMETIFAFSSRNNSQMLPKVFYESNQNIYNEIMEGGGKGNFLAALGRGTREELRLGTVLRKHMESEGLHQKEFQFPDLNSSPNIITYLAKYSEIWNSNSGRFWFTDDTHSIASVTLTDTGIYRRVVTNCRSPVCKIQQKRSNFLKRVLFLESVAKSLVKTVKELSMPPKIETKTHSDGVKLNENIRLYNMLSTFLSSLTNWQFRIENKIAELSEQYKKGSNLKTNTVNLVYEYKNGDRINESSIIENNSNSPYFVIGDQSSNIPTLNNVIENYYGHTNTTNSSYNSPMIVKVIT